jgi:transposase
MATAGPPTSPGVLLAVLLYGHCTGIRSSRQLERRCQEDIAFRVLAANTTPDHVTIARFRVRHEQALAGLLVQSLQLCTAAGMVRLGLISLDGTKIEADAAATANRTRPPPGPGRRAARPGSDHQPGRGSPARSRGR